MCPHKWNGGKGPDGQREGGQSEQARRLCSTLTGLQFAVWDLSGMGEQRVRGTGTDPQHRI